jgi:Kef-type K+ transport system membrane component KefB
MNAYYIIIACSLIVIISSLFNWVSKLTNIPSVLLLIGLGMIIRWGTNQFGLSDKELGLDNLLEILGNVGLVFIVLEAALDLKLEKKKLPLLFRSFIVAAVGLSATMFGLAYLFTFFFPSASFYTLLVYATPLSIMSSAIIIPSVNALRGAKKEFMIYESTFSDILGIMVFYFLMGAIGNSNSNEIALEIVLNTFATIVLSVLASFLIVFLMQHLTMQVKLFPVIAVLILLFAVGKSFHLSSLLLILVFGLILNNTTVFFRGKVGRYFDHQIVGKLLGDFHTLTLESAFLIRTFFFVLFGFSIIVTSLYDWRIAVYGVLISAVFYLIRFVCLILFARKHLFPEVWIAPRGLITILLFFSIAKNNQLNIPGFDSGMLLYPIFITSFIMTIGLLTHKGKKFSEAVKEQLPLFQRHEGTDFL